MSLKKDKVKYTVSPNSMNGRREVHINYSYNGKDYKRSVVYVKDNPNYKEKDYIRDAKNGVNTTYNIQPRPKMRSHLPIFPIIVGLVIAGGLGVGGYYLYKAIGNNGQRYNPGTQVDVKTDIHDPYKSGCKVTLSNTNAKVNEKYETKITLEPASENARYQYRLPDQLDRITSNTVELEGGQFVYTYKNDLEAELSIDAQYVYGPVNVEFTLIQFTPATTFVVSFIGNNSFATYKGNPFISDSFDIDKGVSLVISPSTTGGHYKLKDAITLKVDDTVVDPSTYSYIPIAGTDSYQLTFIVTGKTDIYVSTTEYCVVSFDCEPMVKEPIWVLKGEKLTSEQLASPTYKNHSFLGWYSDDTLLEKFDATKEITNDISLYGSYLNGDINEPLTFTCVDCGEDDEAVINLIVRFYSDSIDQIERNLFYRIIRKGQQPDEWSPIACADPDGNFAIKKNELDDEGFVVKKILPDEVKLYYGDKIQFKGNNPDGFSLSIPSGFDYDTDLRIAFLTLPDLEEGHDIGDKYNLSGNIMSLINADNYSSMDTIPNEYCFQYLFSQLTINSYKYYDKKYGCNVVNADKLILPITTLSEGCYYSMFYCNFTLKSANLTLPAMSLKESCYDCMFYHCDTLNIAPCLPAKILADYCYDYMFAYTDILTAPEIPATTVAPHCCDGMFLDCYSLVYGPSILPATKLEVDCYYDMFYECHSLLKAPELPATNLEDSCYEEMFYDCEVLTKAPELPANILAKECYYSMFEECHALKTAPELPATVLAEYCYEEMFQDCDTLKVAPKLSCTNLKEGCYYMMFYDCYNLEIAPELPATTLVDYCYYSMFEFCYELRYLKVGFGTPNSYDWPGASECTAEWMYSAGAYVEGECIFEWKGKEGEDAEWYGDEDYVEDYWTIKSY